MDAFARILLLIACALGAPTVVVWGLWKLVGFVPAEVREAVLTITPYGLIAVIWVALVWLGLYIFSEMV